MLAIRSNTGMPFRRDEVTFAADMWTLQKKLTKRQAEEAENGKLIVLSDGKDGGDPRLVPFPIQGEEAQEPNTARLAELEKENAALRAQLADLESKSDSDKKTENKQTEPGAAHTEPDTAHNATLPKDK